MPHRDGRDQQLSRSGANAQGAPDHPLDSASFTLSNPNVIPIKCTSSTLETRVNPAGTPGSPDGTNTDSDIARSDIA